MEFINIQNYKVSNNDIVISRRSIVKFMYIMIYLYIYAINYKRVNAYFNKKNQEKVDLKVQEPVEEQEILRLIRPVEDANEEVEDADEEDEVASLENDATVWYTIDDKKARYKGEWNNGLPNGKGIKHVYEGDYYIEGNFVDGFAEGYCKQTFEQTWEKSQPYYEGEIKKNEYQGMGEYHYGDGDYYKGEWKNSKYHGQGAEYSKRLNKTWVGEFCNDEKVEGNWVKGEI